MKGERWSLLNDGLARNNWLNLWLETKVEKNMNLT
jgi:hypothetical protein